MLQRNPIVYSPNDGAVSPPPPPTSPPTSPPPPPLSPPPPPPPADGWRTGIAPEFAEVHQVKTAKDINDLVRWGVNAEKMVGADKIALPGKDAKPEEREALLGTIYEKLGRPKDATGYVFPEVKDRPYADGDKALQGAFAPVAHKLGLTQDQVAGVAAFQNELVAKSIEHATRVSGETEAHLRKLHGDKYDEKLNAGNAALDATLNAAGINVEAFRQMQLSDGSYLGDSKHMAGLFIALGEMISPTGFNGGEGGGGGVGGFANPAAAKAELDKLYGTTFLDTKHPYNDKRNPQHGAWVDRVMKLESLAGQAHGEKK